MSENEKLWANKPESTPVEECSMSYEKPAIWEEDGMEFPEELWWEFSEGKWCFGCTNCNCN